MRKFLTLALVAAHAIMPSEVCFVNSTLIDKTNISSCIYNEKPKESFRFKDLEFEGYNSSETPLPGATQS